MNDITRRTATENEPVLRHAAGKVAADVPAMRSKSQALSNLDNMCRSSILIAKSNAVERQRLNAEKLSKGYSVVHSKSNADKENIVRLNSVRHGTKENVLQSRSFLAAPRSSVLGVRTNASLSSRTSVFRVPTKPAKTKQTIATEPGLTKSCSVTSLTSFPTSVIQEVPKPAQVNDLVNSLGTLFIDDDLKNVKDVFQLGIYAKDIFRFLKRLETEQSVRCGYLTRQHIMTEAMRAVLVDWMYEVQSSFDLMQDTVQMAVAMLDRFIQDNARIPKDDLQLVGVTCIFLAAKYEEMYPPELEQVSADACSRSQILRMEKRIFRALDFNVGRAPPAQFLRRYSRLAQVTADTYSLSKYFVDLALVQYGFCHLPPSQLAAAALFLAIYCSSENCSYEDIWTPKLHFFSDYSAQTLHPIVVKLAQLVVSAPKLKQKSVQDMYANQKKHNAASLRSELGSEKIKKLAARS